MKWPRYSIRDLEEIAYADKLLLQCDEEIKSILREQQANEYEDCILTYDQVKRYVVRAKKLLKTYKPSDHYDEIMKLYKDSIEELQSYIEVHYILENHEQIYNCLDLFDIKNTLLLIKAARNRIKYKM